MDSPIAVAAGLEAQGKYREALSAYKKIAVKNLSDADILYVKRSVAACSYYLKDYANAEKAFAEILKENNINDDEREDIEDCLYLCCLYGNKIEKAEKYFADKLKLSGSDYQSDVWNYWYMGQIRYLKKDYLKAEALYENALEAAKKSNNAKIKFFLAHLAGAEIVLKKYDTAWKHIKQNSEYKDNSSGLYKIVLGILKKCTQPDSDWKKLYDQGMKEAENNGFEENTELGKALLKITGYLD